MIQKFSNKFSSRRALVAASTTGLIALATGQTLAQVRSARPAKARAPRYGTLADASLGVNGDLNGDIPFPLDSPWNTDISNVQHYPADPRSDEIIAHIGAGTGLHADFGPPPYGIPYVVVGAHQRLVRLTVSARGGYPEDSDQGLFPIPSGAPIEGGPDGYRKGGDAHLLVLSREPIAGRNVQLFEMWRARPNPDGSWQADSAAAFDIRSNIVRPAFQGRCGVTSADAAGLPIFPGLVRYDEVATGEIRHALRFTAESTRAAFVPPAVHWASHANRPNLPPMGARLRLKAGYVIPREFSRETRAILDALKRYGMILADNGQNWFISGTSDPRWSNTRVPDELRTVKGRHFEVLALRGLRYRC